MSERGKKWALYRAECHENNTQDDYIFVVRLTAGPSEMVRQAYGRDARQQVLHEAFGDLPAAVARCVEWMKQ
jgi:hypothetical protein